jgi:hypothetical protein
MSNEGWIWIKHLRIGANVGAFNRHNEHAGFNGLRKLDMNRNGSNEQLIGVERYSVQR